jgi:predicted amidohydrolase
MTQFAIAGVQMAAAASGNLAGMIRLVELTLARFPWVEMILFGELCAHGVPLGRAEPMPGPTEEQFATIARRHGIWLIPGSLYEAAEGRVYNTSPVINPKGEIVARHRKLYPFLPFEAGVASGERHTLFDVPGVGRFGLSICYDMWFPETTRALAWEGAEVILHPSLTNTIDRELELAICRASAVMNQCYFLDINSTGSLGNGQSIVVGPEGDIIHQAGVLEEIVPFVVDLDRVRRTRRDGLLGLGQVLKSFRDGDVPYAHQEPGQRKSPALAALGPLAMPRRQSR